MSNKKIPLVMCGALHLMLFVPIISLLLTCEVGVATTFYRKGGVPQQISGRALVSRPPPVVLTLFPLNPPVWQLAEAHP